MICSLKKIYWIFSILILLIISIGCSYNNDPNYISDDEYECYIIDSENKKVAIGNLMKQSGDGVAYVPYMIDEYTVTRLGVNNYMNAELSNYSINRLYLPSTIEHIRERYISLGARSEFTAFFCNSPIDLYNFCQNSNENLKIYVPSVYYEEYLSLNTNFYGLILEANVCYYFNLNDNDYYYIDYCEDGSLITFVPPIPSNSGYEFGGWYKEKECINEWDFEKDTVKLEDNLKEIRLYAKWIKE